MGQYLLKLPKMGESVAEATLTKWLKEIGDTIEMDDPIVEIATDKVDTDVTSEKEGVLLEKRFEENEVIAVGDVIAVIQFDGDSEPSKGIDSHTQIEKTTVIPEVNPSVQEEVAAPEKVAEQLMEEISPSASFSAPTSQGHSKFYSPLVRNIAQEEGISLKELDSLKGTGLDKRVTKTDILNYIKSRNSPPKLSSVPPKKTEVISESKPSVSLNGDDQIIEMSRMEKLISSHMKSSLETAAHVQSFIEVDVTDLWNWREEVKSTFQKRENDKLTFTPLFMTAIIKALKDYPALNSSVKGDQIVIKQAINLGMATALPDGNLIVPVIKNADHLNLVGLAKAVNDLANRSRENQLKPDEVQDGTYTFTNIGNFGSIMGTPIINQPQVGILAIGAIRKMPAVIETPEGDFIGIRKKVILSHSYDHRIINGATGGMFVKRVAEYLENWEETLPY
jgi:2-oxoglutarate dehydrogenase E2 component (dihydrolipoamide succinyltransferase)